MTPFKNISDEALVEATLSLQAGTSQRDNTLMGTAYDEIIKRLSPAEDGFLQVAIDSCDHLGDDWTVDCITDTLLDPDIGIHSKIAAGLAYHIVHTCRRCL
jgi:hypothetical protein